MCCLAAAGPGAGGGPTEDGGDVSGEGQATDNVGRATARTARRRPRLTGRQVNLLLELLVVLALVTGLVSWIVPLSWARTLTVAHATAGFLIVLVLPWKVRGPVRTGFRRANSTRWVSTGFGVLVLATIVLGVAHTAGTWFGVGYWTPLWSHQLIGLLTVPFLMWHVTTRPVRPSITDMNRRGFLTTSAATAVAVAAIGVQETVLDRAGLRGGGRDGTGSIEAGSFDPDTMPTVQWFNDSAPADTAADDWMLTIAGRTVAIEELRDQAEPITARLDCTGGWYADQRWDAVTVASLLPPDSAGRSVKVTSSTGYSRLFPFDAAADLYLAVGYDGRPLRRGHGAPVRIVAPNRRGPQWVKWVVEVEPSDRPAWLQLPLPPT